MIFDRNISGGEETDLARQAGEIEITILNHYGRIADVRMVAGKIFVRISKGVSIFGIGRIESKVKSIEGYGELLSILGISRNVLRRGSLLVVCTGNSYHGILAQNNCTVFHSNVSYVSKLMRLALDHTVKVARGTAHSYGVTAKVYGHIAVELGKIASAVCILRHTVITSYKDHNAVTCESSLCNSACGKCVISGNEFAVLEDSERIIVYVEILTGDSSVFGNYVVSAHRNCKSYVCRWHRIDNV